MLTPPSNFKQGEHMASKVQKRCRICGELYTPCSDCENDRHIFRWRTVACSRECGMKYFKAIEGSRKTKKSTAKKAESDESMQILGNGFSEKDKEKPEKPQKRTYNKSKEKSLQITET